MDQLRPLVDIGVNLTHRRFAADRDAVMERARAAGVEAMVLTGVDMAGSEAAAALAAETVDCVNTAGVHPHHASDWDADTAAAVRALAGRSKTVAIGETGLDFNRDFSPRPAQEKAFAAQLELAAELGLPVFLHQRDAAERFTAILADYRDALPGAVVHCFTDGRDVLHPLLDLDCHIGVTGWVCDERRGSALRESLGDIPGDRLMVETDAPFLPPRDLRPKPPHGRNEPAFLVHIARRIAELRGESAEALAEATTRNARAFFGLGD
ncbi:3'-5' ssDNA/RNA exonuclease TatD [wastewater metagenome]|uniref:3'-5' ssDNA/RNA exonuclease TatD n=2 Tax=unclassified sequences TaxID=12908 RepID=A0A5B8R7R9_9ZZZZ|nr:TatD family hydrolase [Arhodomonas sp. KWT]QEA05169.1 3'-5' ssDNA/RNA exonuclease TatD [uncultured organism]